MNSKLKVRWKDEPEEAEIGAPNNEDEGDEFTDKLDIYRHMAEVHSRVQKDISSDFIMAKLGDKDKEYIQEMICNAYFIKSMITGIKHHADTDREKREIEKIGGEIFDACVSKPYMIVILNRNLPNNPLMRLMAGSPEEEQAEEEREEKKGLAKFLEGLKDKLKRQDQ